MTTNRYKQFQRVADEVFHATTASVDLDLMDLGNLVSLAEGVGRERLRFCAHRSRDDFLHEMFIVHPRGAYVRPHKHIGKSESTLILEGEIDYFEFDLDGKINQVTRMGDLHSRKSFYKRIGESTYHSFLIRSERVVFLEVTQGPFQKSDTFLAPWSPAEEKVEDARAFLKNLEKRSQEI